MKPLLDTHVLLWWLQGDSRLPDGYLDVLNGAGSANPLLLSEISLWEIATLQSLGRIEFEMPLRDWLDRATAPPLIQKVGISTAIAAEVAAIPDSFHRDPADRVIVATARVLGAKLMSCDQKIVNSGLVEVLA